jgi:putative tricarboxylic transport membrane protein
MAVPARYLMPIVLVISTIGVWTLSYSSLDLILTGGAGLLGYYMRKNRYPIEPLILGLILGGRMEQAYRQALIISRGSPLIFLQKPISLTLLLCALIFLLLPTILEKSRQFQTSRKLSAGA